MNEGPARADFIVHRSDFIVQLGRDAMGTINRGGGHGFGRRCGFGRFYISFVSPRRALAWAGVWVGLLLLAPLGCGGCSHKPPPPAAAPGGPPLVRVRLIEGASQ